MSLDNNKLNNKKNNLQEVNNSKSIKDIFMSSYNIFAQAVIKRTLPSFYDGFKTVQRRILFSMFNRGIFSKFNKSATTVGDVIGHYHPHGTDSVYFALTKLVQKFYNSYPFLIGQGNFGSIDGDIAAASRYTEVKLSNYSKFCLEYLNYPKTYSQQKNFDETLDEPCYFPIKVPNLLIRGSQGVAVAMVASIPSHNLSEVLDALIQMIQNKIEKKNKLTIWELMEFIKGPDFVYKNIIDGKKLFSIYKTGKGSIKIYSDIILSKDKNSLIINSIPYGITKEHVRENLFDIILNKNKIPIINKIIDESEGDGVKIRLNLNRIINEREFNVIKNKLYKFTFLKRNLFINFLGLNKDNKPENFNLQKYLYFFLDFRINIEKKRIATDIEKIKLHILRLETLILVYKNTNDIISIIKENNKSNIYELLNFKYKLKRIQIDYLLTLPLSKLSKKEYTSESIKLEESKIKLNELEKLYNTNYLLLKFIQDDFKYIKKRFGIERKSKIVDININKADCYYDENYILYLTSQGYIFKKINNVFKIQKKGQGFKVALKGVKNYGDINCIKYCNNKNIILLSSKNGKFMICKVFELFKNQNFINSLSFFKSVANNLIIMDEFINNPNTTLLFITHFGNIVKLKNIAKIDNVKRRGVKLRKDDYLKFVMPYINKEYLIVASKNGHYLILNLNIFSLSKRGSKGKRSLKLSKGDYIVSANLCNKEDFESIYFLIFFDNGYAKIVSLDIKSKQANRKNNLKGSRLISKKNNNNKLINIFIIDIEKKYELYILSDKNKTVRMDISNITTRKSKFSLGKKIIKDKIIKVTIKEINKNEY